MVWGMSLPSSFGEFWSDGSFEATPDATSGWGSRLKSYYLELSPEDQSALFDYVDTASRGKAGPYVSFVVGKFLHEQGAKGGADMPPFSPILAHEPPRFFVIERGGKSLGSLIMLSNRMLAVEEALKTIIERLEPSLHQFFPIEIMNRKGDVYPKSYYTLVIGQYFDSFSPEASKEGSCELDITRFRYRDNKAGISGLAFQKSLFGSAHLWRERQIIGLLTCFSDELIAEIAEAGLRIPRHYKMMEV
ncbi:imm11 family protein [Sphingobium subterraneum]|uniref:Immunity MXAN-0049 protein domain-containing protein n=1 Tax=Sphingobium subterraneum TaxID=627688 RepID=A0A841J159_9SPHN|nr:DUF1629 domain-containing protein [Sphingobium subterraneum]MBB6124444.1 hypothetical protein [Sphingobium subterraneum]